MKLFDLTSNVNIKQSHAWFLILFLLIQYSFYSCNIFGIAFFKYLRYCINAFYAITFLVCALRCKKDSKSLLEKAMILMYLVFFIALTVGIMDGQYVDYALKGAANTYLMWGVYFYLKRYYIPEDFIMRLIKLFIVGTFVVVILCYIQFPNCWFGVSGDDVAEALLASAEDRGTMRFSIAGKFLVSLLIFYQLQSFTMSRKSIFRLATCFAFLLLAGHRVPFVVTALLSVLMIVFSKVIRTKTKIQLVGMMAILCSLVFVIPATKNIIDKQTALTEEGGANGVGDDNIRIRMATYYLTEFNAPHDLYHKILGNGIYFPNSGEYAKRIEALQDAHFFLVDVEYVQFYIYFGILGMIALLLWYISVLSIKIPKDYVYIKYFVIYIALSATTGGYWVWHIPVLSMLSYVLWRKHCCLYKVK